MNVGHKALGPAARASLLVGVALLIGGAGPTRDLSFEERVQAQRAIEQVYWEHRIWPQENLAPKPPLAAVLTEEAIRTRVEDYLRKSNALERWWGRPITVEQLQAEMDRMAAQTRDPRMLGDLFEALGNEPLLIAETLARQALADRLIRNWYAVDDRFHGDLRKMAEEAVVACRSAECMHAQGGEYREIVLTSRQWVEGPDGDQVGVAERLEPGEWREQLERLAALVGGAPEALSVGTVGGLEETTEAFGVTAVLSQAEDEGPDGDAGVVEAILRQLVEDRARDAERSRRERSGRARAPCPGLTLVCERQVEGTGSGRASPARRTHRRVDRGGDDRVGRGGRKHG